MLLSSCSLVNVEMELVNQSYSFLLVGELSSEIFYFILPLTY
jgi:hypothetical protein